jgi:hypothetical protein
MAGNSPARRWVRRFLIGMLSLMLVMGPAVLSPKRHEAAAPGGLLPAPAPANQS